MIIIKEAINVLPKGESASIKVNISQFDYRQKRDFINALNKDVNGYNKLASNFINSSKALIVIDGSDESVRDLEQVFIRYGLLNRIGTLTKVYKLNRY